MSFLSRLKISKTLFLQLLIVIAAFLIMVLLGSHFGSLIVNKYIDHYGNEMISESAETVKNYLQGYEITINDTAFILERMQVRTSNTAEITLAMQEELRLWFHWLQSHNERLTEVTSIYGIVNGNYITTSDWIFPDSYRPESRVWYIGAQKAGRKIFCSDPYADIRTGEHVVSFSKQLFGRDNQPFGVIALDVYISVISDYVSHIELMDAGYGILMDSERHVVVHPQSNLFGKRFEDITEGNGHAEIAQMLMDGKDVSAFEYVSVTGEKNVMFMKELSNRWYIGLALPSTVYYQDVKFMRAILSTTGIFLALILCGVLMFMYISKIRSDSASRVKSDFLANMSHEIRTPMNAIIGMTELLEHEELTTRQRDYVKDIDTSANSLLLIINDILDLSKIESGKFMLSPVNYDFPAMLDNINSMFGYVAQKKGLEFRFETVGQIPKILYGDDIRLRQVLTNICGNAVKYTENGYIRLKVSSLGGKLVFEIRDSGMGIRKEALPGIFNAFEQDKRAKTRHIAGTGLGLAICKAFVEMMDGTIVLDSEYDHGTVVTVIIPFVLGSEPEISSETKTEAQLTIYAPDANVLLVDDNEFNLRVARGLLKLHNIDAKTVMSGKEAIDLVRENNFDIVFMDHMMPEMDGIEATAEIRKLGGRYKNIPIIALTANAVQGAKEMFMINGFNDFISKPIDIHKLANILIDWLPKEKVIQIKKINESLHHSPGDIEKTGKEEKQSNESSPAKAKLLNELSHIDGLDIQKGLFHIGHDLNSYLDILKYFSENCKSYIEELIKSLKEENWKYYTIKAHALKGVLANIGAENLSKWAAKLEKAASDIRNNETDPFCGDLADFQEKLSLVLAENSDFPTEETRETGSVPFLHEQVTLLKEACQQFSFSDTKKIMSVLNEYEWDYAIKIKINSIKQSIASFDYGKAQLFIDQILEMESKGEERV